MEKALNITEMELAILRVLWDEAPVTIGRVADVVYGHRAAPQYATVQKLLERLEAKGYVKRDRSERAHRFSAELAREDLIGQRLTELANGVCGGSVMPLMTELVRSSQLTKDDLHSLKELVEELDKPKPRKKPRRN